MKLEDAIKARLKYDAKTGALVWKHSDRARRAGDLAGSLKPGRRSCYRQLGLQVDGKLYTLYAHRVAWYLHYGQWPERFIDHVNGDGLDNRIENLREATNSQNKCNMKARSDSITGAKGVSRLPGGNYQARITKDGKCNHLGCFAKISEAREAYKRAAIDLHGDFANAG